MKKYVADFETSTENWCKNKTWVWAWAICDIDNPNECKLGNSIETFLEFCKKENNPKFYFHNLKFDASFVIDYIERKLGFKHIKNQEGKITDLSYNTCINNMGAYYSVEIYFKKWKNRVKKVTLYDSYKILPFSVDEIAKSFGLEISKLELDYDKPRKKKHRLTLAEQEYIKHDVQIVAKALKYLFDENLTQMTQGANALYDYRNMFTYKRFKHYFPNVDSIFSEIKRSYKGGFTYLSPEYIEKDLENITVLDINSLYPYIMSTKKLPYRRGCIF